MGFRHIVFTIVLAVNILGQDNQGSDDKTDKRKEVKSVTKDNIKKQQEDQDQTNELDALDDDPFEEEKPDVADPFEAINRGTHYFNDFIFTWFFNPFATGYSYITPRLLRKGIDNAFENLKMPVKLVSSLGQADLGKAGRTLARFTMNSTIGVGGLIDVGDGLFKIKRINEDIGQMFAKWKIGHGFYYVIPFFGPSSARDGIGLVCDLALNPVTHLRRLVTNNFAQSFAVTAGIYTLKTANGLSLRLGQYEDLKKNSLDHYTFFRDLYIQYREKQVQD